MDVKKFPMLIVGVVVALVLAGAVLPVFAETTSATDTFTNTGIGQYKYITSEDTYTFEWKYTDPTNVIVNDSVIPGITGNEILAMGDFTIRVNANATNGYAQLIVSNNESGVTANASDLKDFSATYEEGVLTVTNGTTTKTLETDGFYALVTENGTHTMKRGTDTVYLNVDDTLLVMGLTGVGSQWNTGYMLDGTIEDYTVRQWTGTNSYPAIDITDDKAKVNNYIDLYTVSAFKWNIDNAGTTQAVTYNYFLVPFEVTAEKAVHPDGALAVLLNVLPLLAIAGLVTGAVVWFVVRKG